ncbi:MAG: glycogen debranching enzyme [Clostridium sp.]|nr:glycogen debranching enzyme [Clostridium sp.]
MAKLRDTQLIDETWITGREDIILIPTGKSGGYRVRPGVFGMYGAYMVRGGVNFTIHSAYATSVTLLLYHSGKNRPYAKIPFPEQCHIGQVWAMIVFGLDIEDFEYAYSLDGPWDPAAGLRYKKEQPLLDIYARAVSGQSAWGTINPGFYKGRVVRGRFDWGKEKSPQIMMEDLVIYEMHVRGFTKDASSGVNAPGTFRGIMEKIPYLKQLGINAVELLPVFEFDEMADVREYNGRQLMNFWGYNTVAFFSPNTSYASVTEEHREGEELKELIRELHKNGIECILDVVFNHTAEGDANGPMISFKGFDNRIYYMLKPDGEYYNFSGCGNTVNCNHPVVQDFILDCLRYWTTAYHVDGFRFDLASILGRDENGEPLLKAPILERLACDPVLRDVKLIAEAWDAGGLYQVGSFNHRGRFSEWNGRYRDDLRDFLKGDFGMWETAAKRITGSPDIYDTWRWGYHPSVNFITCHDGFTLCDLYSYAGKHNEANGWNNTDGSDDNRSWNCGAEGETDNPDILALREKLAKNAMAVLLLSRGTPMMLAGDEFLRTQQGNNNAYCQDNEISWVNWDNLKKHKDFQRFVCAMTALRKEHVIIRRRNGKCSFGLPEMMTIAPTDTTKAMGVVFAGRTADGNADDAVILAINVFWEEQTIRLPELPAGKKWKKAADTAAAGGDCLCAKHAAAEASGGECVHMGPRSVQVWKLGQ